MLLGREVEPPTRKYSTGNYFLLRSFARTRQMLWEHEHHGEGEEELTTTKEGLGKGDE